MRAAITRDPNQGIAIDTAAGRVTVYLARRRGRRGFALLVDGPAAAVRRLALRLPGAPRRQAAAPLRETP